MGAALSTGEACTAKVSGSDRGKLLTTFARMGALGIELALSVIIGVLGGRWLDQKLSTAPYLTLAGLLLGAVAGFKSLIQTARRQQQKQSQAELRQASGQDEKGSENEDE